MDSQNFRKSLVFLSIAAGLGLPMQSFAANDPGCPATSGPSTYAPCLAVLPTGASSAGQVSLVHSLNSQQAGGQHSFAVPNAAQLLPTPAALQAANGQPTPVLGVVVGINGDGQMGQSNPTSPAPSCQYGYASGPTWSGWDAIGWNYTCNPPPPCQPVGSPASCPAGETQLSAGTWSTATCSWSAPSCSAPVSPPPCQPTGSPASCPAGETQIGGGAWSTTFCSWSAPLCTNTSSTGSSGGGSTVQQSQPVCTPTGPAPTCPSGYTMQTAATWDSSTCSYTAPGCQPSTPPPQVWDAYAAVGTVFACSYRCSPFPQYIGSFPTEAQAVAAVNSSLASGEAAVFSSPGYGSNWGGGGITYPSVSVVSGPNGGSVYGTVTIGSLSCFPADSMVLMADGLWQSIQSIDEGDMVMGADGVPVAVEQMDRVTLGYGITGAPRKMMGMADGSLLWSEEHAIWTADDGEREWWWSASPRQWRFEAETDHIGGLLDNSTMREGAGYRFANLSGWKTSDVVVREEYGPETRLYLPRTNGVPIIVNGYVVGSGVNQRRYDYAKFSWDPERISDAVMRALVERSERSAQGVIFSSQRVVREVLTMV